jgi:hypothetical protein
MDLDRLSEKLLLAAKTPADESVPYCFEKRIMAHLRELPAPVREPLLFWVRSLWNATPVCLGVCVAAFLLTTGKPTNSATLDVALQNTVMYSTDAFDQVW